jgi:periplasmic divalent cation tolerance protein
MLSTAGTVREANRLAEKLVGERLAACVTVLPGAISHFFWEGKLSREKEAVIIAKTNRSNAEKMINKIKEIHPYQVPEILFFEARRGEKTYSDWVRKSLAKK